MFLISFPLLYPVEHPAVHTLNTRTYLLDASCSKTELSRFWVESYTSGYFSIPSIYTLYVQYSIIKLDGWITNQRLDIKLMISKWAKVTARDGLKLPEMCQSYRRWSKVIGDGLKLLEIG
jgi:hypothetical protein